MPVQKKSENLLNAPYIYIYIYIYIYREREREREKLVDIGKSAKMRKIIGKVIIFCQCFGLSTFRLIFSYIYIYIYIYILFVGWL